MKFRRLGDSTVIVDTYLKATDLMRAAIQRGDRQRFLHALPVLCKGLRALVGDEEFWGALRDAATMDPQERDLALRVLDDDFTGFLNREKECLALAVGEKHATDMTCNVAGAIVELREMPTERTVAVLQERVTNLQAVTCEEAERLERQRTPQDWRRVGELAVRVTQVAAGGATVAVNSWGGLTGTLEPRSAYISIAAGVKQMVQGVGFKVPRE